MKQFRLIITLFIIIFVLSGCRPTAHKNPDWKNAKVIKTPEIIRILESEPVNFVATTHSQSISISLDDGRCFRGVYIPKDAPEKYRKDNNLHDILNLSEYIKKKRSFRTWKTMCE